MLTEINTPHEFFLNDPKLSIQGLHDSELLSLFENKTLLERPESTWYGNEVAVVRMEPHSKDFVVVHVYLATKFQKQQLLKYVFIDIVNYLKENTEYKGIIVPIPETCTHVIKKMKPLGFKYDGRITKKMTWRNKSVDLLYYLRNI